LRFRDFQLAIGAGRSEPHGAAAPLMKSQTRLVEAASSTHGLGECIRPALTKDTDT
jgi:hypothetical protein